MFNEDDFDENPRKKKKKKKPHPLSPHGMESLDWTEEELEELYGEGLSDDMQDMIDQYDGLEFLDDIYEEYDNENFSS